jgi:6,7-dimethyl-8-ribityllumazine synthase
MPHILIVEATFYPEISALLAEGAIEALENAGATYERLNVPGAFEIPAAISMANTSGKYDGFLALGCVIRGETTHYDYVCEESARGLNDLAVQQHVAIGYGILTTENDEQAIARADKRQKNKGAAAVEACLKMIEIKQQYTTI